ncbi:MAG TPA: ribonuclease P protein component [Solirubrobacteraceae bacterium]|nr:ribonuclease P protein component [Solirubrobacteraceae bacterium]
MTTRQPSRGRLSRSAEFERVYRHGRSVANRELVLYSFPNPAASAPRLGLSVSRKVGGAVERNRVKRLLREAFDRHDGLRAGHDLVVIARPPASELAATGGLAGMDASLSQLLVKAGLDAGTSAESAAASGAAGS